MFFDYLAVRLNGAHATTMIRRGDLNDVVLSTAPIATQVLRANC